MKMTVNGFYIDLTVDEFIELNSKMKVIDEEKPEEAADDVKTDNSVLTVDEIPNNYIGSGELAKLLDVNIATLNKFRHAGMPHVTTNYAIGGKGYLYDPDECVTWYKNYKKEHPYPPKDMVKKNKPKAIVKPKEDDGEYIDTIEMAKILGVGVSSMYNLRRYGMPCTKTQSPKNSKLAYSYNKEKCIEWYMKYKKDHPRYRTYKKAKYPDVVTLDCSNNEYALWKGNLTSMCRDAGKDVGKMLGLAYKYMTKNYGVVWEQEEKEFREANGYRPYSTTQLAFWIELTKPSYKNLVSSCLDTVLKEETA